MSSIPNTTPTPSPTFCAVESALAGTPAASEAVVVVIVVGLALPSKEETPVGHPATVTVVVVTPKRAAPVGHAVPAVAVAASAIPARAKAVPPASAVGRGTPSVSTDAATLQAEALVPQAQWPLLEQGVRAEPVEVETGEGQSVSVWAFLGGVAA